MSIRSNTICLFLFLCATVTICQDVEQTSEEIPEDSDDESSIWMEYEFGTGAGNREGIEKLFQAKKKKKILKIIYHHISRTHSDEYFRSRVHKCARNSEKLAILGSERHQIFISKRKIYPFLQ